MKNELWIWALLMVFLGSFGGAFVVGGRSAGDLLMERLGYVLIGIAIVLGISGIGHLLSKERMGKAKLTVNILFVLGTIAILISYIFGVFIHKDWIVFGSGWVVAITLMT